MSGMFYDCTKLTEIKVTTGKWVISDECDITDMFTNCNVSSVTEYAA